ncbi:hypothetical protein [Marinomonas transparens]|uniref:Uncharacterized protein n=1 Tax=Marinomonas transparens TaxID=2795388 RepID=A0A934N893_9GAMM|nr:hypothetical protein [Marinomonas transparens]MBJ7539846.1 hypothetical protein [Marinomonas transparens]
MLKRKWPKYVREVNGRIVYRPRIPAEERHLIDVDKHGFLKPPVRLGSTKDKESTILSAYITAKNSIEIQAGEGKNTIRYIVAKYMNSPVFRALATTSRHRAKSLVKILDHSITANGEAILFGELSIASITRPVARRLADKRLEDMIERGLKGTSTINQEMSLLHSATRWALERMDSLGITESPFNIKKFKVEENGRYVTDEEYDIQSKVAGEMQPYLPFFFEITYLIATRGVETLDLKTSHIDPNREKGGISVARRKGSKDNVIEWTDRLYRAYLQAIDYLKEKKAYGEDVPLIVGTTGTKLSVSGLQTAMQRLKKEMKERGLENVFWTVHLLKSKAVSDADSDRIAGHKSEAMRNRYSTKTERHKAAR